MFEIHERYLVGTSDSGKIMAGVRTFPHTFPPRSLQATEIEAQGPLSVRSRTQQCQRGSNARKTNGSRRAGVNGSSVRRPSARSLRNETLWCDRGRHPGVAAISRGNADQDFWTAVPLPFHGLSNTRKMKGSGRAGTNGVPAIDSNSSRHSSTGALYRRRRHRRVPAIARRNAQ